MKKLLFGLLLTVISLAGSAQAVPCDPAQNGLAIAPGVITVGQTADFKFDIYNGGTNPGCSIAANSVRVVLSLPSTIVGAPNYYQFQSFVSPAGGAGAYFNWTYDAVNNVIKGINFNPIPNGVGEASVTIRVTGTNTTAITGAISNLNIQVFSGSNNTSNDFSTAPLIVTALVATTMSDITVSSAECVAKLNWTTYTEDAGTKFDVEYSADGINFVKVGTLPGRASTGAAYEFTYNQGSGRGYYRLRTVNLSGSYYYSRTFTANLNCTAKKVFIYPNPLQVGQLLNVNVTGYSGGIKTELMTVSGQVLMTREMQNGLNHLDVGKLPQGVYNFKITDDSGTTQNFKVVVVK